MLLVGFGKMMKKKLLIKDRDLVHHYCLNHRLELAYKHAMKKHIAFPTIDKMNGLIHGWYSKSPKRTSFLDEMMALKGGTSFRISPSIETRFELILLHSACKKCSIHKI